MLNTGQAQSLECNSSNYCVYSMTLAGSSSGPSQQELYQPTPGYSPEAGMWQGLSPTVGIDCIIPYLGRILPLVPECSMPLALRPITMSNTILIRTELAYEVKKKSFILNKQPDSAGPARGNWLPKKEQTKKKNQQ